MDIDNLTNDFEEKENIAQFSKEFSVNKYLELRLEGKETVIYVNGERFDQCKFLLLNIPVSEIKSFDEIDSIDEAAEKLDRSLEPLHDERIDEIPPEVEFWGHCSNLQVWVERNYDTRLIHSNLAFPLLGELSFAGDSVAKKVFNEEIAKRFLSGHQGVMKFLFESGFLNFLSDDEYGYMFNEFKAEGIQGNFVTYGNRLIGFANRKELSLSKRDIEINHEILGVRINKISEIMGLNSITELESLDISGHEITEIEGLDHLINLRKLVLAGNKITEIRGLDNLTKLEVLTLIGNDITEIKGLDNLTNLKRLNLAANKITKIEGLDNLINLEELKLSRNQISEIVGLTKLKSLKSLVLFDNLITEIKGLGNLVNLKKLLLTNNNIVEIKGLENLPNLKSIGLSDNKIPKEIIQRIGTDGQNHVRYCRKREGVL